MDKIKHLLEEAGWYEGRRVDIEYMIDDLRKAGLTIPNDLISELLTEFWNLELNFILSDGLSSNIRLNIEEAMMGIMIEELEKLQRATNDKLVPAGLIHFESALLFVSYSGKFYMIVERQMFLIGQNFFDMLETVVFRKGISQLG